MNDTKTDPIKLDHPQLLLRDEMALSRLAKEVAARVLRPDLTAPGFAALDLGPGLSVEEFQAILNALASALATVYQQQFGKRLAIVSQGRFDQQRSTAAHRDGGPARSLLVLGYEPTEVDSRLFLLDYTRCACEKNLHPRDYLDQFNPMSQGAIDPCLERETREVRDFSSDRYRILVINNSALGPDEDHGGMLGVLHKATIERPDPGKSRPINSLMLYVADAEERA